MSKIGRYSADRKKVQNLTTQYTASVADCGTIFTCASGTDTGTGADGQYEFVLPAVAKAGNGWWAKFVLTAVDGGDVTIEQKTTDTNDIVNVTVVQAYNPLVGTVASGSLGIAADGFTFDVSACAVGDTVEVWTDGTKWYGQAITSGAAAVVAYNA